ncbi:unnamed protein product, partial [Didymodactylos carnosus]
DVPHFTQKALIRDYIVEQYPQLKSIFVLPGCYVQNWLTVPPEKTNDGTVVFRAPFDQKTKLHLVDIDDTGSIVVEILKNPDQYIGQDICICGEEIAFEDVPKVFQKVTGKPAIAQTSTEDEFRSNFEKKHMPKSAQDDLFNMYKWFEQYGYYGPKNDWKSGLKLAKLNTFESWLKKTGWTGPN